MLIEQARLIRVGSERKPTQSWIALPQPPLPRVFVHSQKGYKSLRIPPPKNK
jgi:hypothetical protein